MIPIFVYISCRPLQEVQFDGTFKQDDIVEFTSQLVGLLDGYREFDAISSDLEMLARDLAPSGVEPKLVCLPIKGEGGLAVGIGVRIEVDTLTKANTLPGFVPLWSTTQVVPYPSAI